MFLCSNIHTTYFRSFKETTPQRHFLLFATKFFNLEQFFVAWQVVTWVKIRATSLCNLQRYNTDFKLVYDSRKIIANRALHFPILMRIIFRIPKNPEVSSLTFRFGSVQLCSCVNNVGPILYGERLVETVLLITQRKSFKGLHTREEISH